MKLIITGYEQEQPTFGYFILGKDFHERVIAQKELSFPSFIINDKSMLFTFQKEQETSLLSLIVEKNEVFEKDHIVIPGGKPTHLVYSVKQQVLFGCSYADGTIFSARCIEGRFGELLTYQKQIQQNVKSYCHCVLLNQKEDQIAVINIATDQVLFYNINNGVLIEDKILQLPLGVGPRHGIYNQDCSLLYLVTEYSNEVFVVRMSDFIIIQRISTIPNYHEVSYGATLLFSKDYLHLYVSNRGEDTIAKYIVTPNGLLKYVHSFSCGGKHPRHMILSKDGKYIVSCNKNSNQVAIIDLRTEEVIANIPFLSPSGIVEL